MEEEEKFCEICERFHYQVKLISAVSDGKLLDVCEECAFIENLPVVRKPTPSQLKQGSEKHQNVRARLMKMSGLDKENNKAKEVFDKIKQEKISENQKETYSETLNKVREKNIPVNLIDNYHWEVQMARRRRKLSQKQLADSIGEAEETIALIEKSSLPEQPEKPINKLEQFLNIKLKDSPFSSKQTKSETKTTNNKEPELEKKETPAKVLKFDKETIKNLTISDLVKMKKQKEEREKEELKEMVNSKEKEPFPKKEDSTKQDIKNQKNIEKSKNKKKDSLLGEDIEILNFEED